MPRRILCRVTAIVCAALLSALVPAPAQAAFPGENGRVVFELPVEGVCCDLFSAEPLAGDLRRLTTFAPDRAALQGSWSADGQQIVFRVQRPDDTFGPGALWLMDADGSNQRPLLAARSRDLNPSFSPDGQHVLFTRCNAAITSCAILRVQTDGAGLTRLTPFNEPGVLDFDPRYSPDGSHISFSSFNRDGVAGAVYTMHSDGTHIRQLTPAWVQGFQADWAPDGRSLAFASNCCRGQNAAIWRINLDGTHMEQLTSAATSNFKPVFSPAGDGIAFVRNASDGSVSIWVMRPDGSAEHLFQDSADHPSWGSAP